LAAFPNLSKAVFLGKKEQRQTVENILEILLLMSLPFVTGLLFMGEDLLISIYEKPEFVQAALPLKLVSLILILSPFVRVLGYTLVANGFEKFNLIQVFVVTTVGTLAGLFLIPKYKLMGSALMLVIMSTTAFSLFIYIVYTRLFSFSLWRIFRRPLLISGLMSFIFLCLQQLEIDFWFSLIIAVCSYLIFIGLFAIKTLGSFSGIKEKLGMQK
jgi:O-antigen/teichoic acid export membrane protein